MDIRSFSVSQNEITADTRRPIPSLEIKRMHFDECIKAGAELMRAKNRMWMLNFLYGNPNDECCMINVTGKKCY